MDENIIPFSKVGRKKSLAKISSPRLDDLKETLDQRLQAKLEREQSAEKRRLVREAQNRKNTKKLVTGLLAALLLGGLASTGWALANKDNDLIQKDKEKLTSEYAQLKTRNQTLERENAALLAKLDASRKNAKTLDALSTDLAKAVDHFKTNQSKLVAKLNYSNTTIEQLYKDKAAQAEAFEALTAANQSLEKTNVALNEKMNLLKSIFDQGRHLLGTFKPVQAAPSKEG